MARVPPPGMKVADDALVVIARHRAALGMANSRLDAGRACQAFVRERFSTGK